jgi:hypothetical protein
MMTTTQEERRREMNSKAQDIRQQFLAQACRYLFGPTASCESFMRLGIPALQPIPVRIQEFRR